MKLYYGVLGLDGELGVWIAVGRQNSFGSWLMRWVVDESLCTVWRTELGASAFQAERSRWLCVYVSYGRQRGIRDSLTATEHAWAVANSYEKEQAAS